MFYMIAFWITIAVLVFAVRGDARDWMPDWRKNHISWAYALAVVAAVAQYGTSILFLVYSHHRNKHSREIFLLPTKTQKVRELMFDVRRQAACASEQEAGITHGKSDQAERKPLILKIPAEPTHTDV